MKDQPKRLGRGLAALLGDAAAPAGSPTAVQTLPVELLEPSPFQPRREMDEVALGELAESILQRGVLQPLLVRPHPDKDGCFQIIAGERRWRAAQQARLHEVPVLVRALSNADAMAAGLVENLQREDLNPVEEALGFQRLMEEFKLNHDALAEAVGKSRAHITNMIRLLKLPAKVLEMVKDGRLSFGHAKALMSHSNPLVGATEVLKKDLSVRQTEELVNNLGRTFTEKMLSRPPPPRPDPEALHLSESLTEKLGLQVKVTFNGRNGVVTLKYKNLDQLDGILTLLNQ